ncbi:5'-3' exoribonuclease 2 [Halotydeus destructor]|nr:5'-3' exoribonuclease 2 [Halotydeus destructor]
MGVPAFFRWLSKKYPAIVVPAEQVAQDQDQYGFDNLYLDMNGIIHPCTHPENKAPPENEEEMFLAIYDYIEDIMKMVKPTKLLYMAVDGVAPRAKMNQQRSRRFRASQESIEKKIEIQRIKDDLRSKGVFLEESDKHSFDSNVITPGTQFMINLSIALRSWVDSKLSPEYDDPNGIWPKDMVVILSDASVPGEGEHKLMEYIRKQKALPGYDPNLSHLLCGADADLIMLGLATHELNFTILREEFIPNQPRPCEICNQFGHEMKECEGRARDPDAPPVLATTPGFIFIRLNVLREYLQIESGGIDLERFIDDFVFLCFFVGNDFLPHLPSLEIREGAVDRLLKIYKEVMASYPGKFLTENGLVNLDRVQLILYELGKHEDNIFKQRKESDRRFDERRKRQKREQQANLLNAAWHKPEAPSRNYRPTAFENTKSEAALARAEVFEKDIGSDGNMTAAQKLKLMLMDPDAPKTDPEADRSGQVKRKQPDSDEPREDMVELGDDGWKERYYYHKFDCAMHTNISAKVAEEYVLGLCWVLRYYYQGCPDWQWFYPFHYAPFASDFVNIADMDIKFKYDAKPFKPLEQLMSVFPAASCENLPPSWRKLMTELDSPIVDFYPSGFKIDLNGKTAAWMGVALLPFIDESRLADALTNVYGDLSKDEKERNSLGKHLMFVSKAKRDSSEFLENATLKKKVKVSMAAAVFNGMGGSMLKSRFDKECTGVHCVSFIDPEFPADFVFPAIKLPNAKEPAKILKPDDYIGQFRPTIGMTQSNQRGFIPGAGRRMLGQAMSSAHGGWQGQGQSYGGGEWSLPARDQYDNRQQNQGQRQNNQNYRGRGHQQNQRKRF